MRQTRDQQRFTISGVAADWHEPMVPQRIMWPCIARANGQLDPRCSWQTHHRPNLSISHTSPSPRSSSYYSFPVPLRVGGWVELAWAHNRLATCKRLLAVDRVWVEPATTRLRFRYSTTTPLHPVSTRSRSVVPSRRLCPGLGCCQTTISAVYRHHETVGTVPETLQFRP